MPLTIDVIARELWSDTHHVQIGIAIFRSRCIARRMVCFGFERFINTYAPRELLLVALSMPPMQRFVLINEAYVRGDATVRALIETHAPEALSATEEVVRG